MSDQNHFEGLESMQTLLEGQPLLTTAVQKTPDVRVGSPVDIRVISGKLVLTTTGISQETGVIGGQIRVTTGSTKKDLVGKLIANNVVEVSL